MDSPEKIWVAVLDDLGLQVPQTTFDAWLRDTRPLNVNQSRWEIEVSSPQAQEWLNRHLYPLVNRTFKHVLSLYERSPAELHFTTTSPSRPEIASSQPSPSMDKIIFQFVDFNLFERGWLKVPHYYELFWQPLLGYPAYAFWRYQQLVNWTRYGSHTRNRVIDLSRAAAHIGIDRKVLKGHAGGQVGGALEALQSHGIGEFHVHGKGRHTSYSGRLLRTLPLLSPRQVEQLPPSLQDDHTRWLVDAGYDLDRWYDIDIKYFAGDNSPFGQPDWPSLEPLGYLVTPSYYDLFVQPLLKTVGYGIWRLLKCLYYAPDQRYTRERRITIDEAATRLNCHRQAITGCSRRREGKRYWQPGALDIMRQEGLATIREEGSGRQRAYRIRVLNSPPLLAPLQAQRLPVILRNAHDEWIERARLDLEAWQQLELPMLSDCVNENPIDVQ